MRTKLLALTLAVALGGCSSMPRPLFTEPTAAPILDGVTREDLLSALTACGAPHVGADTLAFCMNAQGYRLDGNTVSRASPERLAGERIEMERDMWMIEQLQQHRTMPTVPNISGSHGGFTCSTLGSQLTGLISCF